MLYTTAHRLTPCRLLMFTLIDPYPGTAVPLERYFRRYDSSKYPGTTLHARPRLSRTRQGQRKSSEVAPPHMQHGTSGGYAMNARPARS